MTASTQPHPYRSSTCRRGPESHPHYCGPGHEDTVLGYRLWVEVEEQEAERVSIGYDTELDEYWTTHTRPTFRSYLCGMRQQH